MKPNRLTIRHITNLTNAIEELTGILGSFVSDDYLKENLQKLLKNDDKIAKLHEAIKYLDKVTEPLYDIEIN